MEYRGYAKHIKKLVNSKAKSLQFQFTFAEEARQCLKQVRFYIDKHDLDLNAYRIKNAVFVEKQE